MIVGILEVKLVMRQAQSLKDKRRIIRSLKDRLRARFNCSVAEVESQDFWQTGELAVVEVSNDSRYVQGALEQALGVIGQCRDAQIASHRIELLHH